jgi:hypothetical protein
MGTPFKIACDSSHHTQSTLYKSSVKKITVHGILGYNRFYLFRLLYGNYSL